MFNLIFLDANTLWHRHLATALGEFAETTAFLPRVGRFPWFRRTEEHGSGNTKFVSVAMPRGWASVTAPLAQACLGHLILSRANARTRLVLASPAYRTLARTVGGKVPYVYYGADDYRSYAGWGRQTREAEAEICGNAMLSVFVSEALRGRAITEYFLDPARTMVLPNGTEPRFAAANTTIPALLEAQTRPILGVLGALSNRLDIELIRATAVLPEVGTFVIAGPVEPELATQPWLRRPKVKVAGPLPHDEMHRYALAFDAALLPYQKNDLNYFCSPLRLYDHLANGIPMFATDACDQINHCGAPNLTILPSHRLTAAIKREIKPLSNRQPAHGVFWSDRARELVRRIDAS